MENENNEVTQIPAGTKVTSERDLDFPSLNWAIKAGEEVELPADPEARTAILSNHFISPVKQII